MIGYELEHRVGVRVTKLLTDWGVYFEDEDEGETIDVMVERKDESRLRDAIEIAEGEVTLDTYRR